MTDIVEIAKERQARLEAEITKLNDFIQMAKMLTEDDDNKAEKKDNSTTFVLV